MRPLRYAINVTLDGCIWGRAQTNRGPAQAGIGSCSPSRARHGGGSGPEANERLRSSSVPAGWADPDRLVSNAQRQGVLLGDEGAARGATRSARLSAAPAHRADGRY